jgi:hypothetical protein
METAMNEISNDSDLKQKEERGPKAPGLNLPTAVELLPQVRDGVGMGRASRETVARALGYNSLNGRSNRVIAALTHFGLLDRVGAAALQVSELGKKVLLPQTETEAREALAEAVQRPSLYQKLFARFAGHGLPSLLPNILSREFGVLPNYGEEVARTFRESVEHAGLLRNGVLHTTLNELSGDLDIGAANSSQAAATQAGQADQTSIVRDLKIVSQRYTIPLDRSGRVATIDVPVPVSSEDLRRIKAWAEYMMTMAEIEVSASAS